MGPGRPASNVRTHVIDLRAATMSTVELLVVLYFPRRGRAAGAVPGRAALAQGSVMGARIVRKRGRPDLAFHHEQLARVIERLEQREAEHNADRVPPFESS